MNISTAKYTNVFSNIFITSCRPASPARPALPVWRHPGRGAGGNLPGYLPAYAGLWFRGGGWGDGVNVCGFP